MVAQGWTGVPSAARTVQREAIGWRRVPGMSGSKRSSQSRSSLSASARLRAGRCAGSISGANWGAKASRSRSGRARSGGRYAMTASTIAAWTRSTSVAVNGSRTAGQRRELATANAGDSCCTVKSTPVPKYRADDPNARMKGGATRGPRW